MDDTTHLPQDLISRRSMMFKGAALGVGATAVGRLLVDPADVLAKKGHTGGHLTRGDAAILRFLAAAEIIESDLWQQYNELAGIQDREVSSTRARQPCRRRAAPPEVSSPRLPRASESRSAARWRPPSAIP